MAVKTRKSANSRENVALELEKQLERDREQYELGTLDLAAVELRYLSRLAAEAKESKNAENRQKTQAGKALKAVIAQDGLSIGDEIQFMDKGYMWDYASSEKVDTEAFLKMFEEGKIKRDIFVQCIGVKKDITTKLVGGYVIDEITSTEKGKTADVRTRVLDVPVDTITVIKKKTKHVKRERIGVNDHDPKQVSAGRTIRKPLRKLKLGKR